MINRYTDVKSICSACFESSSHDVWIIFKRYGPWMDTNLVIPLGPRKCKVVFEYFLDPSLTVKQTNNVDLYRHGPC